MGIGILAAAQAIGRRVGSFLLGGLILWQVAGHVGPSRGRAIVHVSAIPVDLMVDQSFYRVEDLALTPIVCELGPGRHTASLSRDGEVFYQEDFFVVAGEETILSMWDPHVPDPRIQRTAPPRRRSSNNGPGPPPRGRHPGR